MLENRSDGGVNHSLRLRVPAWPGFSPGQFVMLSPGATGAVPRTDPLLPRPMAVYADGPESDTVEVRYKRTGRGTGLLAEAAVGGRVRLVGPLGRGFESPPGDMPVVIVAGGTGVASVYALTRWLAGTRAVSVLLGARTSDDLLGLDDFALLDVSLDVATEDGTRGTRGRVTALLEDALSRAPGCHVYTCGPTLMMQRCAELAAAHGASCVASLENHMACGFGVCLGCAAPLASGGIALVCCEGPVFDASQIDWAGLP